MTADQMAIHNFREYLKIKTVQPSPDYKTCSQFLIAIGKELGIEAQAYEIIKGKPIIIMTLKGSDPSLPSLLLNSHTDVVPVSAEKWTRDPFGAELIDGKIYGRGSQDMKSVGMAYIEALRRLKADNEVTFKRSIHVSFVPDEEIGGVDGMRAFRDTEMFKNLNVGFVLDEGVPSPFSSLLLFNGERAPCWIKIKAIGNAGHGSALLQGTAVERLLKCLDRARHFREQQMQKLTQSDNVLRDCGEVTSVNITMLNAGKQVNVIPDEAIAYVDIRVSKDVDLLNELDEWTRDIPGVSYSFESKCDLLPDTSMDNEIVQTIASVLKEKNISFDAARFPGATDARFLREISIPAIGFSPFRNTPVLLHDHDEYLSVESYLEGIQIYVEIIKRFSQ